jgi:hypothetical protein
MRLTDDRKRGVCGRLIAVTVLVSWIIGCSDGGGDDPPGTQVTPPVSGSGAPSPVGMAGTGSPITGQGGNGSTEQPTGTPLPCNVERVVTNNCGACHGTRLLGGAPMRLMTQEDFTRDYTAVTTASVKGQMFKVYELARMRINDMRAPMPPGGAMPEPDHTALDAWLAAGATARATGETCPNDMPGGMAGTGSTGMAGTGGTMDGEDLCEAADALEPLVPRDGEVCYEFAAHGGQALPDTTKYPVPPGEHYQMFYFDIPWDAPVQGTRFGANYDRIDMQHHWLLLALPALNPAGSHRPSPATLIVEGGGSLLAGWSVGGCNVEFPPDVGLELPNTGLIGVQFHFYNNTDATAEDGSSIVICTVPAGTRPNTNSMTWLGTEDLSIGPGMTDVSGTCPNDSDAPITIWGFWPHMHKFGVNMRGTVNRVGGTSEVLFDKKFDFNNQVTYELKPSIVLMPGDSITTTCSYLNDSTGTVGFGESTEDEMCYQFTYSYPPRALDNGVPSLIGADNVCW